MKSVKCPGCNANLIYNIDKEMLVCEYCGGTYESDDKKLNSDLFKGLELMAARESTCPECGAKLVTDINTISTKCVYCKASIVDNTKITEVFMPKKIILFEINKEIAKKNVKNLLRKNKIPINDNMLNELNPIYLPYWLYDCVAEAQFYKKNVKVLCKGALADASAKISDIFSDKVDGNFNLTKLKDFNVNMIAGHTAELYDVDFNNIYTRINEKLRCAIDQKYKDVCRYTEIEAYENFYILLPFYYLDVGEVQLLVNGQNGIIASSEVMKIKEQKLEHINKLEFRIFWTTVLLITILIFLGNIIDKEIILGLIIINLMIMFVMLFGINIWRRVSKKNVIQEKSSIYIKELK